MDRSRRLTLLLSKQMCTCAGPDTATAVAAGPASQTAVASAGPINAAQAAADLDSSGIFGRRLQQLVATPQTSTSFSGELRPAAFSGTWLPQSGLAVLPAGHADVKAHPCTSCKWL